MANQRGNFIYNNARLALQKSHRQEHRLLRRKVLPYFTGEHARWYAYSYAITILTDRYKSEYRQLVNYYREEYAKRTVPSKKRGSSNLSS